METQIFVACERTLKQLDGFLNRTLAGHGQVCFVIGEAGSGKTALVTEFARRSEEAHKNLVIAIGNCNAQSGIGDPYLPFREVLGLLTGDVEAKQTQGVISQKNADRLRDFLRVSGQALVEVGPDLIGTFVPGTGLAARAATFVAEKVGWLERLDKLKTRKQVDSGRSNLEQSHIFEQYTKVLQVLAEQRPLMLIVDDLQWADTSSISLLFHLGRRIGGSRILLLGTYRPEDVALGRGGERHPLESVGSEFKRYYGDIWVDLDQIEEVEGRRFVDAFLETGPNRLGEEFRQALYLHTGGHPLFTIELLRAMQERGELVHDEEGRWSEGPKLDWGTLPARIEGVIEERIGRLEAELREMLSIASVEGKDFTAQVIAQVQEIKERRLLRELSQELEKRHRLVKEQEVLKIDGRFLSRYRFVHHLFQRYMYNDLSVAERRLLHEEIAQVLEELFEGKTDEIAVQLAFHYREAENVERALHFLSKAGHQSREMYANEEAIHYYTEALNLLPKDHPNRFEFLRSRATVYNLIGSRDEQRADAEKLLAIAKSRNDDSSLYEAYIGLTDYYLETDPIKATQCAKQALTLARNLGNKKREGHALQRVGYAFYRRFDYDQSSNYLKDAADCLHEVGLLGEEAVCLHLLSQAQAGLGNIAESFRIAKSAYKMSREVGDRRQLAVCLKSLAVAHGHNSEYGEALSLAEEALDLHREIGDRSGEWRVLSLLGKLQAYLGNQKESEEYLRSMLSTADLINSTSGIIGAIRNLLHYHIYRKGEYQESLSLLEEWLNKAKSSSDQWLILHFQLQKSYTLEFLGQYTEALKVLEGISEFMERAAGHSLRIEIMATIGANKAKLGDYKEAQQVLEEALDLAESTESSADIAWVLNEMASLSLMKGGEAVLRSGLEFAKRAVVLMREPASKINFSELLLTQTNLCLMLGELDDEHEISNEVQSIIEEVPFVFMPQEYSFSRYKVHSALGQENEAEEYLRHAYERVMLVANNTSDKELRRSWLKNVRVNKEILEVCAERRIS